MQTGRREFLLAAMAAFAFAACAGPEPEILDKSVSEWSTQLDSNDRQDRLAAVRAIGEIARRNPQDSRSVTALHKAFTHEDSAVRHWAVRSAGSLGDDASQFEEDLRARLNDDEMQVRYFLEIVLDAPRAFIGAILDDRLPAPVTVQRDYVAHSVSAATS